MTMAALEQALSFLSRTDLIAAARQQVLPVGITNLLKICSGDKETLLAAQESSRHSQEDVRHAAEFYVQQILFSPDSDHYRVLGVDPDDAEARIKLHYRLLVRWLHPDKNSSDWEVVFSERINRAWHALRTPERRRQYDEQIESEHASHKNVVHNREIKPAQWRDNKIDARFMSARTIKRLPIAVFSLLGVGALLALLLFSQMQPDLQSTSIASSDTKTLPKMEPRVAEPVAAVRDAQVVLGSHQDNSSVQSAGKSQPEENQKTPVSAVIPQPLPIAVIESDEPPVVAPKVAVKAPMQVVTAPKKQKPLKESTEQNTLSSTPMLAVKIATEVKPNSRVSRKKRAALAKAEIEGSAAGTAVIATSNAAVFNTPVTQVDIASDASVKQFLQRFSRVYSEGDYFALHNLFTKDLSILGAAPQRTVLRSYRQLFENSQSREIALDHITWLTSDENIVVIASYQAQILPRGKVEVQSSRGDIRLDLRIENGQLRIIRLRSDTKDG
jgi:hypothetical protein